LRGFENQNPHKKALHLDRAFFDFLEESRIC
jgi:hypothetical protein